jgi:hypothetical protein
MIYYIYRDSITVPIYNIMCVCVCTYRCTGTRRVSLSEYGAETAKRVWICVRPAVSAGETWISIMGYTPPGRRRRRKTERKKR